MVTRFKQYGNDYLYVYPNSRTVCDDSNNDHYGESEYRSDLHTSASHLSRRNTNGLANHFEQWYHRNLVTRFKQYSYDYLYVYPNRGSVCDYSNDDHNSKSEYRSDVYASASHLSRRNTNGLTDHV